MAATFIFSNQQILDTNGDPIVGAKLESYAEGTSTPLATYSDEALTTANANPASGATTGNQVTGSDGRFGNIYLQALAYKFILKDDGGNTIWTIDNFNPDGGAASIGEVPDNLFRVVDNADSTKKLAFQASGITTGNTRTLTVPDYDATIATLSGTETLTNKTVNLASNTLTGTAAEFDTACSDDNFVFEGDDGNSVAALFGLAYIAADIDAMQAATWTAGNAPALIWVPQFHYSGDGGGFFRFDSADTTTADNNGTVIVTSSGRRYKYVPMNGVLPAALFGMNASNSAANNTTAFEAAFEACTGTGYNHVVALPDGSISINATVLGDGADGSSMNTYNDIDIVGHGGGSASGVGSSGTTLVYAGSSGGTALTIEGPMRGVNFRRWRLSGGFLAATVLLEKTLFGSTKDEFLVIDPQAEGRAYYPYTRANTALSAGTQNLNICTFVAQAARAIAVDLGKVGYLDSSGYGGVSRLHFNNCEFYGNDSAIIIGAGDNNRWYGGIAYTTNEYEPTKVEGVTLSGNDPVSITATAHPYSNGDIVQFWNVPGTTELNGNYYTVANVSTNAYELSGTDSANFTAFGTAVTISGVTAADPGVITTGAAHGLSVGDRVYIDGVSGMTELNGNTYIVSKVPSTTTFSCFGLDTTAFTAYTSGGSVHGVGVVGGYGVEFRGPCEGSGFSFERSFPTENMFDSFVPLKGIGGGHGAAGGSIFDKYPITDGATIPTIRRVHVRASDGRTYVNGKRQYNTRQISTAQSTGSLSTTNMSYEDMSGVSVTLTCEANTKLRVQYSVRVSKSSGGSGDTILALNGSTQGFTQRSAGATGFGETCSGEAIFDAATGSNTVKVQWKSSDGNTFSAFNWSLIVEELY